MNDGTPLHQVVWKQEGWPDHVEAAQLLLEFGATMDVPAVAEAARSHGHPEFVEWMEAR